MTKPKLAEAGSTSQLRKEITQKSVARIYWNLYWRTLKNCEWVIDNLNFLFEWTRMASVEEIRKVENYIARIEELSEETAEKIKEIQRTFIELNKICRGEVDDA